MFLLYIATGIAQMVLYGKASSGEGTAAVLAAMAQHAAVLRVTVLLSLGTFFEAVVLAVALYALTREVDQDLAVLGLCFRVSEGVIAAVSAIRLLALLDVAVWGGGGGGTIGLGESLMKQGGWAGSVAAICFALGSTVYCYLFLRARSIPRVLAWLGLGASVLLVVGLPLQLVGYLGGGPMVSLIWLPMLLFEVPFGIWLLVRGVGEPKRRQS